MVGVINIEHNGDEDADRHLIDMALNYHNKGRLIRTKYNYKPSTQLDRYNRKHGPQIS